MFQGSGFSPPPPCGLPPCVPQESLGFLTKLRVFRGFLAQWLLATLKDIAELWLQGASSRLASNTIH